MPVEIQVVGPSSSGRLRPCYSLADVSGEVLRFIVKARIDLCE